MNKGHQNCRERKKNSKKVKSDKNIYSTKHIRNIEQIKEKQKKI